MPIQTGTAMDEPLSAYSSLLDVSSSHEDEGIVFTVNGIQRTPSPQQPYAKEGSSCSDNEDDSSLQNPSQKTLTELTLPWKRDVETGVGGYPDSANFVHRQQEFPSWIENRDYLIHGSPTNTLLSRLGNASKRVSAPAVFEIFGQSDHSSSPSLHRQNSQDSLCISTTTTRRSSGDSSETNAPLSKSTRIDVNKVAPKDVVIEIKVNGKSPPSSIIHSDDDIESQATRL
ncbi:hypothetical protein X975_15782, partial [Stegodyphus mimosarum]